MFELSVQSDFGAAHRICGYPGKCDRLHGHNWQVEAAVSGEALDELGMLIDFKLLKSALNEILDGLDHYYLNELAPFKEQNPSAENIARYIFLQLEEDERLKGKCHVSYVKVWETAKSAALYRRGNA